jgi:hypothetical protein
VRIFAEKGYFAARMRDVAEAAGVADGTLYPPRQQAAPQPEGHLLVDVPVGVGDLFREDRGSLSLGAIVNHVLGDAGPPFKTSSLA